MNTKKAFQGKHSELTDLVIKAFYIVYNELGYGFSEKIYEKAMVIVLTGMGLIVEKEKRIPVYFRGEVLGEYIADLVINGAVMVELKAVSHTLEVHEAQLLNYLKATEIEVGLLLNFGPEPKVIRKAYDNTQKGTLSWTKI